jgi:signal transduction histidine kinase
VPRARTPEMRAHSDNAVFGTGIQGRVRGAYVRSGGEVSRRAVGGPNTWAPTARMLTIGVAYWCAGELAGLLAVPPGYAAPIWPAAGIAVVGVILFGAEAAAGVFLASLAINLHIALRTGDRAFEDGLLVALALAAGAAAQGLVAAWLTRRVLGPGNPIERGASVPMFLLVAGPLACLVSASWALLWLLVCGHVHPRDAFPNVFTWWVGDSIGVMLVAPLLLAWLARTGQPRPREWAGLLAPICICLATVVTLFFEARRRSDLELAGQFQEDATLVASNLGRQLDHAAAHVESAARVFGALPAIDRRAFGLMARPWILAHPGVTAVEWVPLVPLDQTAAFEAASRDSTFPEYRIIPRGPDTPVPTPRPPFHAPILFVEPLEQERLVVGYDLASSPQRLRALEEARDTGAVVSTGGIRLVLFPGEWGLLMTAAAYGGVEPPETLAERRATVRGFNTAVVRVDQLVADTLVRSGRDDLVIRVVEVSDEGGTRLLSGPPLGTEPPEAPMWTSDYTVGGQRLRVDVLHVHGAPYPWVGWSVLAAGLAGTGLFVAFVLESRGRSLRVERLVEARTAELARSNEALTRSSLELQRFAYVASHDLREPLRTITAFGELLERDTERLDPDVRAHLCRITRATRRMQALVSELLAFTRADRGVEAFAPVPLDEPVHAALDDLTVAIEQCEARIRIGSLPTVLGDRVQLVQLFTNLLSNALKFRSPGVPVEIVVDGRAVGERCEIEVHDNGIGIGVRDHERIFELFQRLHPEGRYPGSGVGLAMCRRIVERHGGRIWVDSELGRGSVFHIWLPHAVSP